MTLIIKDLNPFNKRYVADRAEASVVPKQVGQKLLRLHKTLLASEAREWSLTEMQKERLGEHLEKEYGTLIDLLGENFHSVVVRMAVQIERITMILTAMRGDSALSRGAGNELMPESDSGLTSEIAMILTAMRGMEQGVKTATLKEERLKCTDSKSDEGVLCNDETWQEQGQVLKIEYGHYRKAC